MSSVVCEEPVKNIFILHRCNTGGTPFPLCPIGCSSNYPLGKRRLGEQPYYFSSSVITCRYILFTAQEFLREVQAGAYRMHLHHGWVWVTSAPSPNLISIYGWLFPIFFILIEGIMSLSWSCSYSGGGASDVVLWLCSERHLWRQMFTHRRSEHSCKDIPSSIIQINNWFCYAQKVLGFIIEQPQNSQK